MIVSVLSAPPDAKAQPPERMPFLAKLGYASGNLGKSLQWNTVDFLYLYFLTDLLGIPASLAGVIILVSLVWDGISDPLVGYLIDRAGGRLASYQRLILYFAPLALMGFLSIFLLPIYAPGSVVVWALLAGLLFRTGYTLVDVPHNSMLADISRDSRERASLSAYRFFFSSLGSAALSLAVLPALKGEDGPNQQGFIMFALVTGGLYLAVMWFSAISSGATGSRVTRRESEGALVTALMRLARNQRLLIMATIAAATALFIPMFAKMALFYAKSWLADPALGTLLMVAYAIGQIISLPIWLAAAQRLEKRTAAIAACLVLVVGCISFLLVLPREPMLAAGWFALAGFAFGGINTMNWAMIPDTVEYTEARDGERHEALTFGLMVLNMKVFSGVSIALVGWTLSVSGYDAASAMPGDMLMGIPLCMTLAPLVGAMLCIFLLLRLDLSHAGHSTLQQEIRAVSRPG